MALLTGLGKMPFENIVGKGELVGKNNFRLFQVFYSIKDKNYQFCYILYVVCKWSGSKVVVWEWVKQFLRTKSVTKKQTNKCKAEI